MDGTPYLLVKEDILGEPLDAVVEAKGHLPQIPGPLIGIQHLVEELLPLVGPGLHNLSLLEGEAHTVDLHSRVTGGIIEVYMPLHGDLHGRGEDLAVGHVTLAIAVYPLAPLHREGEVRIGTHIAQLLHPLEALPYHLLAGRDLFPVGHRVLPIHPTGGKEKPLVLQKRHLGILGKGLGGIRGQDPAELSLHLPFVQDIPDLPLGRPGPGNPGGIHVGKLPGIGLAQKCDETVDGPGRHPVYLRDKSELGIPGQGVKEVVLPLKGEPHHGMGSPL